MVVGAAVVTGAAVVGGADVVVGAAVEVVVDVSSPLPPEPSPSLAQAASTTTPRMNASTHRNDLRDMSPPPLKLKPGSVEPLNRSCMGRRRITPRPGSR
jgi:hypothetical protein